VNVCRGRYGGAKEGKEVQGEINFQGVPRGTRPGRDEPQPLPFIYPNLYPNTEYQHLAVVIFVLGERKSDLNSDNLELQYIRKMRSLPSISSTWQL
jgi:hypothetical protein